MVNKSETEFIVGKSDEIKLEGLVLTPNFSKPVSTIYFLEGLGGHFKDYSNLLEPLANEFKVVAHNYRGHGKSEGFFHPVDCADDLNNIANFEDEKGHLLTHSIGAMISVNAVSKNPEKFSSNYMINPVINDSCLTSYFQTGLKKLDFAKRMKILPFVDKALYTLGLSGHFRHIAQAHSTVNKYNAGRDSRKYENTGIQTALLLTYRDEILGTRNKEHRKSMKSMIDWNFKLVEEQSEQFKNLGHCLNLKKGDYSPFFKPEKGKDNVALIEKIASFYRCNS